MNTLKYRFREKPLKQGSNLVLVVGGKGDEKQINLSITIAKNAYDANTQSIKNNEIANALLMQAKAKIEGIINRLRLAEKPLTATIVANEFENKPNETKNTAPNFGAVLKMVIEDYTEQKTQKFALHTIQTRQQNALVIMDFIKFEFGTQNIDLEDFKPLNVDNFWAYLTKKQLLSTETSRRYIETARKIYQKANANGWYAFNPFADFKIKGRKKPIQYLQDDEIQAIEALNLSNTPFEFERDLFVFLLQTGLCYTDLKSLSYQEIRVDKSLVVAIYGKRNKNGNEFVVPITDKAQSVINKHGKTDKNGLVFDVPTNQHLNRVLKTIGTMAAINRLELVCHLARKTFGTQRATEGYSTQYITKTLGHSTYKTSEKYYAVNTDEMVLNEHKKRH